MAAALTLPEVGDGEVVVEWNCLIWRILANLKMQANYQVFRQGATYRSSKDNPFPSFITGHLYLRNAGFQASFKAHLC